MSNPSKRTKKEARERRKRWDRGKGDLGEQFRFTLYIHPKKKCDQGVLLKSCKIFLYPWYNFIFQNASVLVFMTANLCYVNPINLDKTLALYFQRPHGAFRIVNEMIERQ